MTTGNFYCPRVERLRPFVGSVTDASGTAK